MANIFWYNVPCTKTTTTTNTTRQSAQDRRRSMGKYTSHHEVKDCLYNWASIQRLCKMSSSCRNQIESFCSGRWWEAILLNGQVPSAIYVLWLPDTVDPAPKACHQTLFCGNQLNHLAAVTLVWRLGEQTVDLHHVLVGNEKRVGAKWPPAGRPSRSQQMDVRWHAHSESRGIVRRQERRDVTHARWSLQ